MVIQIIVTIGIVLLVFPTVYSAFKKKTISLFSLIIWTLFWVGGIVIIWNPSLMGKISGFMGVQRSIDAIVYLAIVFLLYIVFRFRIRLNEMQREITMLTRKLAIKDINKKK
ncbi:DUF2304 domain-containing protein [bacterium]|nr:DUF2304 domain-containing protein [bacterium]